MGNNDVGKFVIAHIDDFRYEGILLEITDQVYIVRDRKTNDKVYLPKQSTLIKVPSTGQEDEQKHQ